MITRLFKNRREKLDPRPMSLPIGITRPPTLQEQIHALMRNERFRQALEDQGLETFEEADDFDVGDDVDPQTPYELEFDPDLGREVTRAEKADLDAHRAAFDGLAREAAKRKRNAKAAEQPKTLTQEVPAESKK